MFLIVTRTGHVNACTVSDKWADSVAHTYVHTCVCICCIIFTFPGLLNTFIMQVGSHVARIEFALLAWFRVLQKYSSETRFVLLISRVLYEADNEPETCAALFVLARKFPHDVAAVELLIKALADGMFGYILKAACLLLYYA